MSINLSTSNSNIKMVKGAIIKSVAKNLLIYSPFIFGMMFINYFVDPGGLFRAVGYEKGIARILAKGLNVANVNNYDERLLQKYYIDADKKPKDVIVLGSSRVLQMNAGNSDSNKFFNHGVSGATLEDLFSIYEMYEDKNKLPHTIILGLDPWLLNINSGQLRWQSLRKYDLAFMNRLQGGKTISTFFYRYDCLKFDITRGLNLISPSYFQVAIRYLIHHMPELIKTWKAKKNYYATSLDNLDVDKRLDVDIRIADGTIGYGKVGILKMREDVITYVTNDPVYSLGKFYELDRVSQRNFEKFIAYLLKKDIKVIFFFPPYHPYVYTYLMNSTQYQIIAKVETYFRTIGNQKNIMVIGSYDPRQCGLAEEDFYDGMHPNREGMSKVIEIFNTTIVSKNHSLQPAEKRI